MQAVGEYIRLLRKGRGMSRNALVLATGLNATYIWRIEKGEYEDSHMDKISKLIEALKGNGDHVFKLFSHPNPSNEYIQQLASEALLSDEERERSAALLTTDEETRRLLEMVHEKSADPALRNRIRGYVDSLTTGGDPPPSPVRQRTSHRRPAE